MFCRCWCERARARVCVQSSLGYHNALPQSVGVLLLEPEPIYQAILGGCVVGTGLVYLILYCIPNARPEKMRN